MTRFEEMLALYDQAVMTAARAREAAKLEQLEKERAQALAETQRLYEIGPSLLGALWAELAPAEAGPWGNTVPLRWAPGYAYLELRFGYYQDAGKKVERPFLRLNAGRRDNGHWTLWLPAPVEQIAEFCARAVSHRAEERANDLYRLTTGYWDIDECDDEALAERAAQEIRDWPDAEGDISAWLAQQMDRRAKNREQAQARIAERDAERSAVTAAQSQAPTDAERALALLRELVDLVHPQPEQE